MKYKIYLNPSLKTNFIALPRNSPLASIQDGAKQNEGLHCTPVRIEIEQNEKGEKEVHYFGWTGAISQCSQSSNQQSFECDPNNSIEMSEQLGRAIGFETGMIISAQIEYSCRRLESLELEPITSQDFDLIQNNSEYVEENILNQLQIFYPTQKFVMHFPNGQHAKFLTKIYQKNEERNLNSLFKNKCYYLTQESELHIIPKSSQQQNQEEKKIENTDQSNQEQDFSIDEKTQEQIQKQILKIQIEQSNMGKYLPSTLYISNDQRQLKKIKKPQYLQIIKHSKLFSLNFKEYLSVKDDNNKKREKEHLDPFSSEWINQKGQWVNIQYTENKEEGILPNGIICGINGGFERNQIVLAELFDMKMEEINHFKINKMQINFSTSIPYLHNLITKDHNSQEGHDTEFIFTIVKTIFFLFVQSSYFQNSETIIFNDGQTFKISDSLLLEYIKIYRNYRIRQNVDLLQSQSNDQNKYLLELEFIQQMIEILNINKNQINEIIYQVYVSQNQQQRRNLQLQNNQQRDKNQKQINDYFIEINNQQIDKILQDLINQITNIDLEILMAYNKDHHKVMSLDYFQNFENQIQKIDEKFLVFEWVNTETKLISELKNLFVKEDDSSQQSVLIYGQKDVGKTWLFNNLKNILQIQSIYLDVIDCVELNSCIQSRQANGISSSAKVIDYAIDYMEMHYNRALQFGNNSILVLDNLQALCSHINKDDNNQNIIEFIKTEKITNVINKWIQQSLVKIVAISPHYSMLNSRLFEIAYLDSVFEIKPPSKNQRYSFFKTIFHQHFSINIQDVKLQKLAQLSEGFLCKNLFQVFQFLKIHFIKNNNQDDEQCFFNKIENFMKDQKEKYFSNGNDLQSVLESAPDWNDQIGGLIEVKNKIEEIFGFSQKYSIFFTGQKITQGLLLFGPPGCGKTYLALAIAKRFNMNFISVKGPELLNKYIGASEQNVRELFEKAQRQKPCILFFDEFDSLVPKRGSNQTAVTDRIVNQFLCYLDGVEGRDGVFVMAASSRPDLVDVALLRPGRIDKSVLCDFPNLDERKLIFQVYFKLFKFKSKYQSNQDQSQKYDEFLQQIAERTVNFTSADIKGIVQNSQLEKISEIQKSQMNQNQQDGNKEEQELILDEDNILNSLKSFSKGMSSQEVNRFREIYRKYMDKSSVQDITNQKQISQ